MKETPSLMLGEKKSALTPIYFGIFEPLPIFFLDFLTYYHESYKPTVKI